MAEQYKRKKPNPVLFNKNYYTIPEKTKSNEKSPETEGLLRSSLTLFLLFGTFIILIAFFGEYGILSFRELEQKRQNLTAEIQALKEREQNLLHEIDALKNNPEYIESLARKELGLVRKDEVIYFLPEESPPEKP
ncbi:MAG: septum formation initiator family protein [SAR324 cluster bacterium]|nr:septum formation initiator family protein [SAR324 cluster bacterium]